MSALASSSATTQYWCIAVPNEAKDPERTLGMLSGKSKGLSQVFRLAMPTLKVGTVDALMQLSDDLGKTDTFVEGMVKKIERTLGEIFKTNQSDERKGKVARDQKDAKDQMALDLRVTSRGRQLTPEQFVEEFVWDDMRYHKKKPIQALCEGIFKDVTKNDDDLKQQLNEYQELRNTAITLERKETGSLMTRNLTPFLAPNDVIETEHLTTIFIIVPRARQKEFLDTYEVMEDQHIAREAEKERERQARMQKQKASETKKPAVVEEVVQKLQDDEEEEKKEEKKEDVKESKQEAKAEEKKAVEEKKSTLVLPKTVVPRSAKLLYPKPSGSMSAVSSSSASSSSSSANAADEDVENVLFRLVLFKPGLDSFKNILRERRFHVRHFHYDPETDRKEQEKLQATIQQKSTAYTKLVNWCRVNYADIFSAWIHVKVMRLFVEGVLRYGLQADCTTDFSAFLMKPKKNMEKRLRDVLYGLYSKLADSSFLDSLEGGERDLEAGSGEFYPYVYLPLSISSSE